MKFINKMIRILVIFLIIKNVRCQNGYSDQNNIHMKQVPSNDGEVETITSYSTNVIQSDPKSHSVSSVNSQYQIVDDANNKFSDYDRADRGRTRKIYRIKNPFHQQVEEDANKQNGNIGSQDGETGASNQYAGMQYSMPPEEFLQQMRAESQYNQQQQQQLQQISTPGPSFGYTATPQPQYQYSTISSSNYNNGNPQNLSPQLEQKYPPQFYNNNLNSYQYNNAHLFGIEAIQSTPSSVTLFLSTSSPNNQYIGTPSNNYVSSSSPIFLSSPANSPSYVSTSSNTQTGSPPYNNVNRYPSTVERDAFNYGTNNRDSSQNIYVNHFDNSANGVKFPSNIQQQFQNEISSTQTPISSMYPEINRDNWQNIMPSSLNNLPNSKSEYTQASQQNSQSKYQETQQSSNSDNPSNNVHQIGSMPSANNLVLSFVQPDYQTINDLKNRDREMEQQNKREDVYSHGDYGWKLDGRKPLVNYDVNLPTNYPNQQSNNNYQADSSSLNFSYRQMANEKNYEYDHKSKYQNEKTEAQEFAKAAAKAQENMKNEQETYLNNYSLHARYPQSILTNAEPGNIMINNNNNQNSFINDNKNTYGNKQSELVKPPFYFQNSRENTFDNKLKQPLDQDKVLQSIIKVDVSSAIPNVDPQLNVVTEVNDRHISSNYSKDINENLKQFLKPFSEIYYKDKNVNYGLNTKPTTSEVFSPDGSRRIEPSYENAKKYEPTSNFNNLVYKPHADMGLPSFHYMSQSSSGNTQAQSNIQQQSLQRSRNQESFDSSNILKLNDIPYWLQGMSNMHLSQLQNGVNQGVMPTGTPLVLNQNIESHQIDVASSILNKLLRDKEMEMKFKQNYDFQRETLLPTINGLKVMNPFNLDLKVVNEILKDKTNDVQSFRNQFNQANPLTWDMSQLKQILLKNDNAGQYTVMNDGIGGPSSFYEVHTNNRFPYQGVKYSRSQGEAETLIPITDSTHSHPIGAVIEQDDLVNENRESMDSDLEGSNDVFSVDTEDDKPKINPNYRIIGNRYRNSNSLLPDRHSFQKKNPKILIGEPYPLLKPPPIRTLRGRSRNKFDNNRRQRGNKYKLSRIVKREPSFDEDNLNEDVKENIPILLRPSFIAEDKSDVTQNNDS